MEIGMGGHTLGKKERQDRLLGQKKTPVCMKITGARLEEQRQSKVCADTSEGVMMVRLQVYAVYGFMLTGVRVIIC